MIIGRAAELARLDGLLDELRGGRGDTLVLRGEPGIGKTTLLDELVARAGDGVTVLRAAGVESETEIAFAALSDLLGPVVADLSALPATQAAALAGALALGPPQPGDRLAICVASLGLLRSVAVRRPVLVAVDDLQWLDAPSRECVLFAARRVGGPIGFALTARDAHGVAPDWNQLPMLRLGRLGYDTSLELLSQAVPDLAEQVARQIVTAAAGNPLALVELPTVLSQKQRIGSAGLNLPLVADGRLHSSYARRIEELPPPARRALLVAATYQGDNMAVVAAACRELNTDVTLLAPAEGRGLVRIADGHLSFAHPLIRGAAFHAASADERRGAHRALGEVLTGEDRAWHLAAAALGPDERVAAELEAAAGVAIARRGYASAATALERAARLSPEPADFARRLLAAGETASAAGQLDRSLALLAETAATAADERVSARADHLRGLTMMWRGGAVDAVELLARHGNRVADSAPDLAASMLADAAMASAVIGEARHTLELAERAVGLLAGAGDPATRGHVLATYGWALVISGHTTQAHRWTDEAVELVGTIDPLSPAAQSIVIALNVRLPTGEFEQALTDSLAICERAREAGAIGALPNPLIVAADAAYRLGDWARAEAASAEGLQVAEETGQQNWWAHGLVIRARLAAAQGREADSRWAAQNALDLARSYGLGSGRVFALAALGFLELGLERIDEAIDALDRVERAVTQFGFDEPTLIPWAPDLIEAYVRAARPADASRVLAMLDRQTAGSGTVCARAALARCRGLVEPDFVAGFTEALELDRERPMPFERARTLLGYGRRLHRAGQRAAARERLHEALAGFERLGAKPWAVQARNELRAAGGRLRAAKDDAAAGQLTAQEQRVAATVARGASNRDIAAELFLAPKTVEFHLRQIYRKLGVGSRAQLIVMLAGTARPLNEQQE